MAKTKWPAESDTDTPSRGIPKYVDDALIRPYGGFAPIPFEDIIIERTRGFFRYRSARLLFTVSVDWNIRAVVVSAGFWTCGYGW